jgi:DNA helicase-2/ATP-dependent DNA helicase PcrA
MSENAPYLTGLNEPQQTAVLHREGPLLIVAGAGSGKTRVITHRIVNLIHHGVAPHHILAVTFTNKAATEMRDRVHELMKQFLPSERASHDSLPTVTTFHALGVRILREHHATLHIRKFFTIFDRSDSLKAMKLAIEKAGYNPKEFEPKTQLSKVSRAKGDAISQQTYQERAQSFPDQVTAKVWGAYQDILTEEQALDFDDLLVKTLELLTKYPYVREILQQRYQYIHVDEYQDTNKVQFLIAKELAGLKNNICVVGDVDQNIYSWRGADIANVLQFERQFPATTTIFLEENYRSTKTIIAASNDIIAKNRHRVDKKVFTNNDDGELIDLYAAMTGTDEASYVTATCQKLIRDGVAPSSIAILYRTNFQSRVLEEAFLNAAIPYQLLGTKFFERKEIKDVLAYLRLALNPDNTTDLTRIINEPARGIGKVTVLKILEGKRAELTGAVGEKVSRFEQIMSDIRDAIHTKTLPEVITFIISRTGIEADLKKNGTEDDLSRLENLRELVTLATKYEGDDGEVSVEQLLEHAALQSDQDELKNKHEQDAVRLMTVHAAKGLEFPYVFIVGLEEGLFPHERLDDARIDHEEERRLFYVALTRAEKKVFLSYAHMRTIFGSQRINLPSSFLNDISHDYIENVTPGGGNTKSGYETTIYLD